MQLNFDNYLDKMRGCWNGKNIGGTLGAPFEGMRGVFDVRYYTVFQNSLIRGSKTDKVPLRQQIT